MSSLAVQCERCKCITAFGVGKGSKSVDISKQINDSGWMVAAFHGSDQTICRECIEDLEHIREIL